MKEEDFFKKALKEDIKPVDNIFFNQKVIRELNLKKQESRQTIFDAKTSVVLLIISVLVLTAFLIGPMAVSSTYLLIGIFVIISPCYFIIFDKIYQASKKST
ncbi:hypothetical protein OO013_05750 [Mangrovivirga sp. M17]|uniref:Uncharacterized protein n=1 Tax=Mangrovivirga halotolerans TaxID=2993936 RepID=A0ABT3RNK1_9BACT|nr:hypothetical protein [Mangrovivirga halotolerans]MCX2743359.1 hypothetical protein [Mangrovivirga halotolerans]